MKIRLLVLLGLLCAVNTVSAADLRLAQPFQDHMVLQRQMPVPVWGWAAPNKEVTVTMGGQSAKATSDASGYWCAKLPAMEANATGQAVTVSDGTTTLTLNDVLVGEVWFCSGQSNMARTVKWEIIENPQAPKEIYADTDYPQVRFINYPGNASDTPLAEVDPLLGGKAAWEILGPKTVEDSMCMAFFFGRDLFKELNVPVGLVQVAVGGTPQTAWTPKEALDAVKAEGARTYTYDDCFDASEKGLAAGKDPFKSWAEYKAALDAWKANPTGRAPGSLAVMGYPSVLFNAMVHPLAPMAFRGMIWHQGEAGPPTLYGQRMVEMVKSLRKLFDDNFWFITGTMTRKTMTGPPLIPATESLRGGINNEFALEEKLFGPDGRGIMVGMLDLGNVSTHWQRKDEAGRRLALAAMDHVYGKPSVYTGPTLIDSKIEGGNVTCKFSNVGTGLKYVPSIEGISGFVLMGKGKVAWGTPVIQGTDTVVVSSPEVPEPENLFYAYAGNPHETLFNSEGMPAYSFRLKEQLAPRDKPTVELAEAVAPMSDAKTMLNISDVRRYAYVVGFENGHPTPGPNTIKCYIPKEWQKPAAQQDGKDLTLGEITTDAAGNRFVQVTAESNGPSVVLYDAAQPEALASVNLKRY